MGQGEVRAKGEVVVPPDEQDHGVQAVFTPGATDPDTIGPSRGSATEGGAGPEWGQSSTWDQQPPPWYPWDQGSPPRPPTPPPPHTHHHLMILTALLVLAACAVGVGLGYAVSRSTTPPLTSTTTTTTPASPDVATVAARVDPGLVDVDTTLSYQTATGAGTGMVVTSSGEVVTNNHVIEGETSLHVTDVGNGRTYTATVVGYDISADIAVLQITGASHLRTVPFATTPARVGETVVAIGNAGGKGGTPSAVSGTVTGLDQSITADDELSGRVEHLTGMIETDAAIQAGDSGGPLVNTSGQLLGMDTAGSSHFAFSQETTEGFSIPVGTVESIATQTESGKTSSTVHIGATAFLGVDVSNSDTNGAVVVEVLTGTAAAAIGLSRGDTIVSLGGQTIRNPTTLSDVLQAEQPDATIPISWRNPMNQSYTTTVTLRNGPPS